MIVPLDGNIPVPLEQEVALRKMEVIGLVSMAGMEEDGESEVK